jgi:hypothetical protein
MPSPKLVPLLLTDGERKALEALVRKRTASQSLALRARIVLACAEEGGAAPLTSVADCAVDILAQGSSQASSGQLSAGRRSCRDRGPSRDRGPARPGSGR